MTDYEEITVAFSTDYADMQRRIMDEQYRREKQRAYEMDSLRNSLGGAMNELIPTEKPKKPDAPKSNPVLLLLEP